MRKIISVLLSIILAISSVIAVSPISAHTATITDESYTALDTQSIASLKVTIVATNWEYKGVPIRPRVTVQTRTETLTEGVDYTVSYYNNIDVGTASIEITGIGAYTGTVNKTFTIRERPITYTSVELDCEIYAFDGSPKKPYVTVRDGAKILNINQDYTVTYINNTNVGNNATVVINGIGNYCDTIRKTFFIKDTNGFVWGQDNWNFDNSTSYFNDYSVNSKELELLISDFELTNTQSYRMRKLIDKFTAWTGSCYGMVVSEILVKQGDLQLSRYGGHEITYRNSNSDNITSVINFIQQLQSVGNHGQVQKNTQYYDKSQYDYIDKAEQVLSNEGTFIKISYGTKKYDKSDDKYSSAGYHAVLGYGIEDCNYYSSVTGYTYDKRILVCDPNYSNSSKLYDDACIYYKSSDHSWICPYRNSIGSSESYLCYWNYSSGDSTKTGVINSIIKFNSLIESEDVMIDHQVDHYIAGLELKNKSGNEAKLWRILGTGDPSFDYSGEDSDIIKPYDIYENYSITIGPPTLNYSLWDSTSVYDLKFDKLSNYSLYMDYENVSYYSDVNNAIETQFSPRGNITFKGTDANYEVTMVTDASECVTDWYAVTVSCNNTNNMQFKKVDEGYMLLSTNLEDVNVNAMNNNVSVDKKFSSKYKEVLIYEIDENTIGINVDFNNDGTFETPVDVAEGMILGDVDGDNDITIIDVTEIQRYLAHKTTFDNVKSLCADAEKDGVVSIMDATQIQRFIAHIITEL